MDRDTALSIHLQILVQLNFGEDLEGFLVAWDHCLVALRTQPDDDLLRVLLEVQLCQRKALAPAFVVFDGSPKSSE